MKKLLMGLAGSSLLLTQSVFAVDKNNIDVSNLAVDKTDRVSFTYSEFSPCRFNAVYFDLSSDAGKGYLSLLMAAKMAGKKVSVSYDAESINDFTYCTITNVRVP